MKLTAAFLLSFLLVSLSGSSQKLDYLVKHFTTENGLPQNSAKNVAFDSLGYGWVGTENGLAKYDGIGFTIFTEYDIPPQSPRVTCIREDGEGQILVLFEMGERYILKYAGYFGMKPVLSESKYLIGCNDRFIEVKDSIRESQFRFVGSHSKNSPFDTFLMDEGHVFVSSADTVWFARKSGESGYVKTGLTAPTKFVPLEDQLLVFSGSSDIISVDSAGTITTLVPEGEFFKAIDPEARNFSLMSYASVSYGFFNGALYRLTRSGNTLYSEKLLEGLETSTIFHLYHDTRKNHYYLQSQLDGLYIVTPRLFQNVTIPEDGNWHMNSFYGQNRYGKNAIFANGHLFTFGPGNKPPKVEPVLSLPKSLFSAHIEGDVCYYQTGFKLYKYNIRTKDLKIISDLNEPSHCMLRSEFDSKLYFSTTDKLFTIENDTIRQLLRLPLVPNLYIHSFKPVSPDRILFATSSGLWESSLSSKKSDVVIPHINIRNIYIGKDDYIWLGSYNDGVWLMKDGNFRQLPFDKLRRLSVVNSIFEDKYDRIWFSTNNGLLHTYRKPAIRLLDRKGVDYIRYTIFDKSDGLLTNEFNGGATPDKVYLDDGRISIPSLKSLVLFDPESFLPDTAVRRVYIEKIVVDGKVVRDLPGISLRPGYKSMVVTISSPSDNKKEAQNFEWRVKGTGNEWISAAYGEAISLRGYKYGGYTLEIRLKENPQSAIMLPFSVEPFFYETVWFRGTTALLLILIILSAFKLLTRRYEKQNALLERKIQERTGALNESLESLGITVQQLRDTESRLHTSISRKDKIINMLLHDMKSPLFALKNGIEELDDKLNHYEGIQKDVLRKSGLLREGISDVYSFSVNFFDWVKYQKEGIVANYQLTNLKKVFLTIGELYGAIAAKKGLQLLYDTEEIIFYTDENILITILRNLVDNAIKNTPSGTIRMHAYVRRNEYLTIVVHDSGPGMPDKIQESIETALYEEEEDPALQTGCGYKLILHLLDLIHADLELKNSDGLRVSVTLHYITTLEPERCC